MIRAAGTSASGDAQCHRTHVRDALQENRQAIDQIGRTWGRLTPRGPAAAQANRIRSRRVIKSRTRRSSGRHVRARPVAVLDGQARWRRAWPSTGVRAAACEQPAWRLSGPSTPKPTAPISRLHPLADAEVADVRRAQPASSRRSRRTRHTPPPYRLAWCGWSGQLALVSPDEAGPKATGRGLQALRCDDNTRKRTKPWPRSSRGTSWTGPAPTRMEAGPRTHPAAQRARLLAQYLAHRDRPPSVPPQRRRAIALTLQPTSTTSGTETYSVPRP